MGLLPEACVPADPMEVNAESIVFAELLPVVLPETRVPDDPATGKADFVVLLELLPELLLAVAYAESVVLPELFPKLLSETGVPAVANGDFSILLPELLPEEPLPETRAPEVGAEAVLPGAWVIDAESGDTNTSILDSTLFPARPPDAFDKRLKTLL